MAKVLLVGSWTHPTMSLKPRVVAIERYLPLNLLYIATSLRQDGHSVRIIDPSNWGAREIYEGDVNAYKREERVLLKEVIRRAKRADVIGFSTSYFNWISDQWLMNMVAEHNPRIFAGGWGSQRYPGEYLRKTPVMVVVLGLHGEGISTVPEIVPILGDAEVRQKTVASKGETVRLGKLDGKSIKKLAGVKGVRFLEQRVKKTPVRLPEPLPVLHASISEFGLHYKEYRNVNGDLVLPVVGSPAGCPYSLKGKACSYCAQHTYLKRMRGKKFRELVTKFDTERVMGEIEGMVTAASMENEKPNWIFFVDDSMREKNFKDCWKRLKNFNIPVVFSTRPDYLTDSWISHIAKNRIGVNLGLEFFNAEDVRFASRSPTPDAYVRGNRKLVSKLLNKGVRFKAFVFLQGTRKWKNIGANISGTIELLKNGVTLSVCPTPLADFTDMEKEADFLETEHYLGFRIPGFLSYRGTEKGELRRIYRGLGENIRENREELLGMHGLGGPELLESMKMLREMAGEELAY